MTAHIRCGFRPRGALNEGTAFLFPDSGTTLTIPSTAARVITAAAYDGLSFFVCGFFRKGSAGRIWRKRCAKAGPGRSGECVSALRFPGGGYGEFTGTSFAAPFVTGAAALLMEWGIVLGNDPYLYGEKVKAYLRRGARQLPGYAEWPNPQLGYGALCVRDSIPV